MIEHECRNCCKTHLPSLYYCIVVTRQIIFFWDITRHFLTASFRQRVPPELLSRNCKLLPKGYNIITLVYKYPEKSICNTTSFRFTVWMKRMSLVFQSFLSFLESPAALVQELCVSRCWKLIPCLLERPVSCFLRDRLGKA